MNFRNKEVTYICINKQGNKALCDADSVVRSMVMGTG